MAFFADLHVHSNYSRATSKHSNLEHTAQTAREKGITVVGTGDFTHPAWLDELKEKLVPAEPGLFRLRENLHDDLPAVPRAVANRTVRFMLQVEISTIYKKAGETRKVHHLLFVPDFDSADRLVNRLSQIGNLSADGRPILGLDSEDLLEITLEAGDDCHLIPAHIWTPWFSLFGSESGFDSLETCYGSLSEHIFALETGLSSDPPMNWRLSELDDYTLVSNSDAHSPRKMGREACYFDTDLNYFEMFESMKTGDSYLGTVEFYPEEGKYHLDGHRKCDVRLEPGTTRTLDGNCPVCGDPLTVGVLHRVHDLADRESGRTPEGVAYFRSVIPLVEVLSEIEDVGPNTKTVNRLYRRIVGEIGPEFYVLQQAPIDRIESFGRPLLTEAVRRLREGEVIKQAGFDGEYGTIQLFEESELTRRNAAGLLFEDLPESDPEELTVPDLWDDPGHEAFEKGTGDPSTTERSPCKVSGGSILGSLDSDQRRAVKLLDGPLIIIAGPGTGKTRTLTHRLAHLVDERAVPASCLAISFTRRAAREMYDRLQKLLPDRGDAIPVRTFHGFGYEVLHDYHDKANLPSDFRVATDRECLNVIEDEYDCSRSTAQKKLETLKQIDEDHQKGSSGWNSVRERLTERGVIDYNGLLELTVRLLRENRPVKEALRNRYRWISIDEYQDVNHRQYELVRLLAPEGSNLCVIGDPDQAIYGFRGASVKYFQQFEDDYPSATRVKLERNYRSSPTIVEAADQMVSPESLVSERSTEAKRDSEGTLRLHEAPTPEAEAEFVVKMIEEILGGTTFFSFDSSRVDPTGGSSLSFSDIGVLYRTQDQAEAIEEALSRSGLPFRKHTHEPMSEHRIVNFFLDWIESEVPAGSLEDQLEAAAEAWLEDHEKDRKFIQLYEGMKGLLERENLHSLESFRSQLALGRDVDLWDPRAQGVSLLTLHAAKGLEFKLVFIVGCEEELLPLYWDDGEESFPEERRLFFVGMTRAKNQLVLSYSTRRRRNGSTKEVDPSRYLQDIDDDLIEKTTADFRTQTDQPYNSPDANQLELL